MITKNDLPQGDTNTDFCALQFHLNSASRDAALVYWMQGEDAEYHRNCLADSLNKVAASIGLKLVSAHETVEA